VHKPRDDANEPPMNVLAPSTTPPATRQPTQKPNPAPPRIRTVDSGLKRAVAFWVRESVRHEALVKRAVMKGHRGLVVVAAG
jgi:hypothetical protein